jgi:putative PIN family toxin of toxin-antitoxin system
MTTRNRCVFDTNTVISALLLPTSIPRQAFDKALDSGVILLSDALIVELSTVFRRPKFNRYLSEPERLQFLSLILRDAETITISETITDCRDANDNKFLEVAVAGQAHAIISGDKDLLELHPYRGIEILTPRIFLDTFS